MNTPGASSPLGAAICRGGANFNLFSRTAASVELLVFDRDDDARPARAIRLDPIRNRTYHYRHTFVPVAPNKLDRQQNQAGDRP